MPETTGELTIARRGVAALTALKALNGGPAHDLQRQVIGKWPGWGPLAPAFHWGSRGASWDEIRTQVRGLLATDEWQAAQSAVDTAFYTPPAVVAAVWDVLTGLGFTGGTVLEPGCGGGNFMAGTPAGLPVEWTGVESDPLSAEFARALHPAARIICGRLEKTPLRRASFDAVIGNVPFSQAGPYDPAAPELNLHNYFLWRALCAVRPGGIVALVTSRWTLDSADAAQRLELAELGDFVGAIRLPSGALASAGTRTIVDIVVFRRRAASSEPRGDRTWTLQAGPDSPAKLTTISRYFTAVRPELVLGEMTDRGGAQYGQTLDVTLPDGLTLGEALADAVGILVKDAAETRLGWEPRAGEPEIGDDEADLAADGTFTLHADGSISQQQGYRHVTVKPNAELAALIRLRDAAAALFAAEADTNMPAARRELIRTRCRTLYEQYAGQWGLLNRCELSERPDPDEPGDVIVTRKTPKMGGFRSDPGYPTTFAIEIWDDETQSATAAPILLRHVNAAPARKTDTTDPGEALLLCLDECGHVDLAVIARLLGIPAGDVPGRLAGLIWDDPADGQWVTADEYLSGDVRGKLAAARAAALADRRFIGHVEALEAVQPADLPPERITVQLGAPWIPANAVADFAAELLGFRNGTMNRTITVRHEPLTNTWEVHGTTAARQLLTARTLWGTMRVNAVNLIEDALNGTMPVIYDQVDDDTKVRNEPETQMAADRIRGMQERFAEWVWEHPQRAAVLGRLYNDRYNRTRPRSYDGSLLTFPGMAGIFTPYQSQIDMVWRAICSPATLCAHPVGAGKTAIMAMLALTLRRLGMARKPAMIVPNHLLEQETAEVRRLYPGAKILMVTRDDLTPVRRRSFAARCAAGDWDVVIMTHQQFAQLPVSAATQEQFLAARIEELDEAMMAANMEKSRTAKQLARKRRKLTARHEALLDAARDDAAIRWEQTGIDYLMIDEAHYYKNLEMGARAEGFSSAGSKRADDLLMKLGLLRGQHPDGRCGALFTATPVSNALSELHVLFRYLAPDMLTRLGLTSFDAFAGQHILYRTATEVAPDGSGFRSYRRPAEYVNLHALRMMNADIADIRVKAEMGLPGPQVKVTHVAVEPQPELGELTATLVARADRIRAGGIKPTEDNMLAICTDGRMAALDLRLVGITPTGPGKLEAAAARIASIYYVTKNTLYPAADGDGLFQPQPGAVQMVFCDMGTPGVKGDQTYGRLRALLIAAGIPAGRIAYIHEAATHADKAALFARCRNGDIAVLIGSTAKCGTGVNIQARMAAIHHVDAPWRPADVEQRDGRGDRPGNLNDLLEVYRYVTRRSFDAYMWQTLTRKLRFIVQLLCGDADTINVDVPANLQVLSYAELTAMAADQPLLADLAEVNAELARLRALSAGHKRAQAELESEYGRALRDASALNEQVRQLVRIAENADGAEPVLRWDGAGHVGGDAAGVFAMVASQARAHQHRAVAGSWRGVSVSVEPVQQAGNRPPKMQIRLTGAFSLAAHVFTVQTSRPWSELSAAVVLAEIDREVMEARDLAARRRAAEAAARERAGQIKPLLGQQFKDAATMRDLTARRGELEALIDAQVKQPAGNSAEPVVSAA